MTKLDDLLRDFQRINRAKPKSTCLTLLGDFNILGRFKDWKSLSQISIVTANFGECIVFTDIIRDWFEFLGGKPGDVVVVDCGSDAETQTIYWKMFREGLIDKLQLIHPDSNDFGKDKGYIKE